MILTSLRVLKLNKKYHLIEGLGERDQFNPEGIDIDLRVGKVEEIAGESFLGVKDRSSAITKVIGDVKTDGSKVISINPGDYFLVTTMEKINCPKKPVRYVWWLPKAHLIPDIRPRVTLQKAAVSLDFSTTNPGYSGPLVFGISNNGYYPFKFELGSRMFKIYWSPAIGGIKRTYEGQHQGGRSTSQGKLETQV